MDTKINMYILSIFLNVHNHRRAVAQPCVNGDRLSQWRMAKFDPTQIRNPSTDQHKIWNRWLRPRDDPPVQNFVQICPLGASRQMGEI